MAQPFQPTDSNYFDLGDESQLPHLYTGNQQQNEDNSENNYYNYYNSGVKHKPECENYHNEFSLHSETNYIQIQSLTKSILNNPNSQARNYIESESKFSPNYEFKPKNGYTNNDSSPVDCELEPQNLIEQSPNKLASLQPGKETQQQIYFF